MPLILSLLGGLLTIASSLVGRVLLALGLSYVTFSGFQLGADWLKADIQSNMASMPAEVVSFLGFLWVDRAISMVFSAYTVALGIRMAGGTTVTKLVRGAGGS